MTSEGFQAAGQAMSVEAVAHDNARDSGRDSMFLHATLRSAGQQDGYVVRVRNISAGGMMADAAGRFRQDEPVEVELRGVGAVPARIAWADEGRIGVAFLAHIDPRLTRRPVGGRR